MQTFTVYSSDAMQNATNFLYPHKIEVTDAESFRKAVHRDYVFAEYKDGHRSKENFISSDTVILDCDNDHSENPADWLTEELATEVFDDVAYVIHRGRHNNLQKDSYSPRPRKN